MDEGVAVLGVGGSAYGIESAAARLESGGIMKRALSGGAWLAGKVAPWIKPIPILGEGIAMGSEYMHSGSLSRTLGAGVGSLVGRVGGTAAGAFGGPVTAAFGGLGGSILGAKYGADLFGGPLPDPLTAVDPAKNPVQSQGQSHQAQSDSDQSVLGQTKTIQLAPSDVSKALNGPAENSMAEALGTSLGAGHITAASASLAADGGRTMVADSELQSGERRRFNLGLSATGNGQVSGSSFLATPDLQMQRVISMHGSGIVGLDASGRLAGTPQLAGLSRDLSRRLSGPDAFTDLAKAQSGLSQREAIIYEDASGKSPPQMLVAGRDKSGFPVRAGLTVTNGQASFDILDQAGKSQWSKTVIDDGFKVSADGRPQLSGNAAKLSAAFVADPRQSARELSGQNESLSASAVSSVTDQHMQAFLSDLSATKSGTRKRDAMGAAF